MTVVTSAAGKSGKRGGNNSPLMGEAAKARMFLAIACFWPIFILALFAASAPELKEAREHPSQLLDKNNEFNKDFRFNVRKMLDRVDVMGYGPTHPRVAVVVVGDENQKILSTVESVFRCVFFGTAIFYISFDN